MLIHLYHGSDHIIERPVYGQGKHYNDYGMGFYCTEIPELAKEWAVSKNRSGFSNSYELETEGLSILDLNSTDLCLLNWLAVLLKNREFDALSVLAEEAKEYLLENYLIDCDSCDAVTGYRADDSCFSFAQDFLNGTISYRQFGNAMHLGGLGQQFVIKSPRAFERLVFTGYETADSNIWYAKKADRDRTARREYFDREKNGRRRDDIYITNIIDNEVKPDDKRLR